MKQLKKAIVFYKIWVATYYRLFWKSPMWVFSMMPELENCVQEETLAIHRDWKKKKSNLRKRPWILHKALINKVTKEYHGNKEKDELFIIKDKSYDLFIISSIISIFSYSIIIHNLGLSTMELLFSPYKTHWFSGKFHWENVFYM